jgi:hypothetical protein
MIQLGGNASVLRLFLRAFGHYHTNVESYRRAESEKDMYLFSIDET